MIRVLSSRSNLPLVRLFIKQTPGLWCALLVRLLGTAPGDLLPLGVKTCPVVAVWAKPGEPAANKPSEGAMPAAPHGGAYHVMATSRRMLSRYPDDNLGISYMRISVELFVGYRMRSLCS